MAATQPAPAKGISSTKSYLIWGILAFFAVIATSASITLGIGASNGTFNLARFIAPPPPPPPLQPIIRKPEVTEFEVARLRDALRALSEQRDRLNSRVETLEHSMGDITASINTVKERVASPPPAPMKETPEAAAVSIPEPVPPAPAPAVTAVEEAPRPLAVKATPVVEPPVIKAAGHKAHTAAAAQTRHRSARKKVAKPPRISATHRPVWPHPHAAAVSKSKPLQISPPVRTARKDRHTQVAHILHHADVTGSAATKTEFGLDLGGEISMDGLRALWANIKGNHGKLLKGFHPIVRVREGTKPGTVELHLVAGPVADAGSAAHLCASLQHAGVVCRTVEYDGQRLSLR